MSLKTETIDAIERTLVLRSVAGRELANLV